MKHKERYTGLILGCLVILLPNLMEAKLTLSLLSSQPTESSAFRAMSDEDPYYEDYDDDFHYSRRLRRFHRLDPSYTTWSYYDPWYTNDVYFVLGTPAWYRWRQWANPWQMSARQFSRFTFRWGRFSFISYNVYARGWNPYGYADFVYDDPFFGNAWCPPTWRPTYGYGWSNNGWGNRRSYRRGFRAGYNQGWNQGYWASSGVGNIYCPPVRQGGGYSNDFFWQQRNNGRQGSFNRNQVVDRRSSARNPSVRTNRYDLPSDRSGGRVTSNRGTTPTRSRRTYPESTSRDSRDRVAASTRTYPSTRSTSTRVTTSPNRPRPSSDRSVRSSATRSYPSSRPSTRSSSSRSSSPAASSSRSNRTVRPSSSSSRNNSSVRSSSASRTPSYSRPSSRTNPSVRSSRSTTSRSTSSSARSSSSMSRPSSTSSRSSSMQRNSSSRSSSSVRSTSKRPSSSMSSSRSSRSASSSKARSSRATMRRP